MASKEKILRYAQDAANRSGKTMAIHQCRNGQWLYGGKEFYDTAAGRLLVPKGKAVEIVEPLKKE